MNSLTAVAQIKTPAEAGAEANRRWSRGALISSPEYLLSRQEQALASREQEPVERQECR